ncbi:hypothetical protein H0H93_000422, partial [Arthromyces matolae]
MEHIRPILTMTAQKPDIHPEANKRAKVARVENSNCLAGLQEDVLSPDAEGKRSMRCLKEFLESSWPTLVPDPDHTKSTGTRGPAPYDLHLDERFKLKKMFYQPSMVEELEDIVEDAIECYLETHKYLPPVPLKVHKTEISAFPTPAWRSACLERSDYKQIVNEQGIQRTYGSTTGKHCALVAATLEFQDRQWNQRHLQWEIDPVKGLTVGVADGFLKLKEVARKSTPPVSLSNSYIRTKGHFVRGLGVWEFKSLVAGGIDVFRAILEHTTHSEFAWKSCPYKMCCEHQCQVDKNEFGIPSVWAKTGLDAETSVIRDNHAAYVAPKISPEAALTKARDILQQIWAEMVATDSTFGCLDAGLYLLIFRRIRADNALYVSSIIETNKPKYHKIQTGLYIAMLRDAKRRSLRIKKDRPSTWSDSNPNIKGISEVKDSDCNETRQTKIFEEMSSRQWLKFEPSKRGEVGFTFCMKALYDRIDPFSYKLGDPASAYNGDPCITVIAKPDAVVSQGRLSIDKVVFKGCSLMPSEYGYLKHANHDKRSRKRLQWEARVYSRLGQGEAQAYIPMMLGFFRHPNIENLDANPRAEYLTLLLEDTGMSLDKVGPVVLADVADECRKALGQIHASGFCHGEISLKHIVYRENRQPSEITFISFGGAIRNPGELDIERDHAALESALASRSLKRRLNKPTLMTSDVSTDADIIPAAVQTFLNCNPPRLEWTDEIDDRPDLKPPFIFYERHLDARLMLRRVRIVPLESLLSAVVDISFSAIADKGIPLPKIQPDDLFGCLQFPETVGYSNNAGSVSDAYESYISIYSQSVASTVLLHPRASDWDSSLWWLDIAQTRKSSAASLDCYGLRLASTTTITESVLEVTDGEIRQFMETSHRPRHALAWWQLFFFDDEARVLLADMDRIAFSGAFHGSCGTTGYRPAPPGSFPVSPDASRTPWRSPMPSSDAETSESSNQPQLPA